MNKKHYNILIIFILLFFLFQILTNSLVISNTVINSSKIWFYNIIPSILPMYILIDLLINYNLLEMLTILITPISKLFKINKSSSIIFLLSFISGFPSNSKYINTMLENNSLNIVDANKLLMFTHFSNPLFIINSIGINFLHNKLVGIVILISHYSTNFIIGIIHRNYKISSNNNYHFNNKKSSFITTLTSSIYSTIKILFLLYGIITVFMIINEVISLNLHINPLIKTLISGLLEITNGIYLTSLLNINIIYKATIITFFLSFGGFAIHMQVFGILNKYKLNYLNYFKVRIMHGIISGSLVYLILKLLNVS